MKPSAAVCAILLAGCGAQSAPAGAPPAFVERAPVALDLKWLAPGGKLRMTLRNVSAGPVAMPPNLAPFNTVFLEERTKKGDRPCYPGAIFDGPSPHLVWLTSMSPGESRTTTVDIRTFTHTPLHEILAVRAHFILDPQSRVTTSAPAWVGEVQSEWCEIR